MSGDRERTSRSQQPDKEKDEGIGLLGAAGIALGALAGIAGLSVAGKMMYDKYKSQQETPFEQEAARRKSEEVERYQNHFGAPRDCSQSASHLPVEASPMALQRTPQEETLSEKLEDYYWAYAHISDDRMSRAEEIIDDVKESVLQYFQEEKQKALGVTELQGMGSFFEGVRVISLEFECDLLMPIGLPESMWKLVHGQYLDPLTPGFHLIRRLTSAEAPQGSSPYDKYVKDGYLSPELVRNRFKGMLRMVANSINEYGIQHSESGPAITFIVEDDSEVINMDFVPAFVIGSRTVVAKPHENAEKDESLANRWRESYTEMERERLTKWTGDRFCHLKVLKILKAIRLHHHSEFGVLSSYVYKTLLLHMLEDDISDQWTNDCLQERFVDILRNLDDCLEKKNLPHAFDPEVNLMQWICKKKITHLKNYIEPKLKKKKVPTATLR